VNSILHIAGSDRAMIGLSHAADFAFLSDTMRHDYILRYDYIFVRSKTDCIPNITKNF